MVVDRPEPVLKIDVANNGTFTFVLLGEEPETIPTHWIGWPDSSPGEAKRVVENMKPLRRIEQFSREAGNLKFAPELRQIGQAMESLFIIGRLWQDDLFDHEDLERVEEIMRRAVDRAFPATPLITVTAPPHMMPAFEFMPLLGPDSQQRSYDGFDDLLRAARSFVGFSAIIARRFREPKSGTNQTPGKLNIRTFLRHQMEGACLEHRFFHENPASITLTAEWPNQRPLEREEFEAHLAEHLWGANSTQDQFHHFACHCNTESNNANAHYLQLAFQSASPVRLELETLRTLRTGLPCEIRKRIAENKLPMVFLNACNSGQFTLFSPTSFPKFFLHTAGNRGFIGAEATVPDRFAAAFSQEFYCQLLAEKPVGEALFLAKLEMLKRNWNPLGILYTFYGDPSWQPFCGDAKINMLDLSEFLQKKVVCLHGQVE
jgi:hypothetical protein